MGAGIDGDDVSMEGCEVEMMPEFTYLGSRLRDDVLG